MLDTSVASLNVGTTPTENPLLQAFAATTADGIAPTTEADATGVNTSFQFLLTTLQISNQTLTTALPQSLVNATLADPTATTKLNLEISQETATPDLTKEELNPVLYSSFFPGLIQTPLNQTKISTTANVSTTPVTTRGAKQPSQAELTSLLDAASSTTSTSTLTVTVAPLTPQTNVPQNSNLLPPPIPLISSDAAIPPLAKPPEGQVVSPGVPELTAVPSATTGLSTAESNTPPTPEIPAASSSAVNTTAATPKPMFNPLATPNAATVTPPVVTAPTTSPDSGVVGTSPTELARRIGSDLVTVDQTPTPTSITNASQNGFVLPTLARPEDRPTLKNTDSSSTSPISNAPIDRFRNADLFQVTSPQPTNVRSLTEQTSEGIVAQAQQMAKPGESDFRLRLTPPELGEIRVHLRANSEGITAHLSVADDTVRRLIEGQLPDLRQRLEDAGVASNFSVATDAGSNGRGGRFSDRNEPGAVEIPFRPATAGAKLPMKVRSTGSLDVQA